MPNFVELKKNFYPIKDINNLRESEFIHSKLENELNKMDKITEMMDVFYKTEFNDCIVSVSAMKLFIKEMETSLIRMYIPTEVLDDIECHVENDVKKFSMRPNRFFPEISKAMIFNQIQDHIALLLNSPESQTYFQINNELTKYKEDPDEADYVKKLEEKLQALKANPGMYEIARNHKELVRIEKEVSEMF